MDNKENKTVIGLRLTSDEKETMQRKAHESYKTLSSYIRDLALGND